MFYVPTIQNAKKYHLVLILWSSVSGLPDITWGQKIAAVVVTRDGAQLSLADLRQWAREVMPPYQIPTTLKCIDVMPYNAMGKVNKKEVTKLCFPKETMGNKL